MGNNNNHTNPNKKANRLNGKSIPPPIDSIDSIVEHEPYHPLPKRIRLRFRVILTAIAISVVPASILSISTYVITKKAGNKEIIQAQKQVAQIQLLRTENLAEQFSQFLQARFREIEVLAENSTFTNPNLWNSATLEQKQAILTALQAKAKIYEEITFLDTQGNPLFQSKSSQNLYSNYSDREYFQEAIDNKKIVVHRTGLNAQNHKLGVEYIAPIVNIWTGKVKGVIYLFIPEETLTDIFSNYTNNNQQWYFIDSEGIFFAGSNSRYVNNNSQKFFPQIDELYKARKQNTGLYFNELKNNQQLLSYAPVATPGLYPDKYLGAVITTEAFPTLIALETGSWVLLLGIIIIAIIIGFISAYIANNMMTPIINSIKAVDLLSQGKLDTRIPIQGKNELAMLGTKINQMAEKLMYLIERQTMLAKTSELMARIARARNVQQLQSPFNRFLAEVRFLIKSDRLIFYQFDHNWSGTVIAESVAQGFPKSLGAEINDPCFAENYIHKYRRGRIQATRNIYEAGLTECHIQQLENFAVKSNLVIPVVVRTEIEPEKDELIGLLIAHQCSTTRIWNNAEIDYLKEVASQLGLALRGYGICKQVLEQQAIFQQKVNEIIDNNQQLSRGNLRIYHSQSPSELNNLTKFLKDTIKGITELITKIKTNSEVAENSLDNNRKTVTQLNQRIIEQSSQIEQIMTALKPMANQMQLVCKNINETSKISHGTITHLKTETTDLTNVIESMAKLQNNFSKSINEIKNLEQLSIEIIGSIPIFKKIILETELLSKQVDQQSIKTKDSLSKKIQKLATQLLLIVSEIEATGENIQRQTSGIVRAMEIDSAQTAGITPIAEEANRNIAKIFNTSFEIDRLLQLTNNSAMSQIASLQKIVNLINKLTQLAERSSYQSQQAKNSLKVTEVAIERLQESINIFKVEK